MRTFIRAMLAAILANVAILLTPQAASAEDQILISRSDLQMLLQQPQGLTLPEGSGKLRLIDGVPTLDKIATSLVPIICTQIIYGPDSPWADICSSRMSIEGGMLIRSPNPSAIINLDAFNKSVLGAVCMPFGCADIMPICRANQRYDAASNSCAPLTPLTVCPASDQGCLSEEVLALLKRIPDCSVAICLPDDLLSLIQKDLPDFAQGPVQRAVAAGLTSISIQDGNLQAAIAGLGADQALLLRP